jgi:hypothetical protein
MGPMKLDISTTEKILHVARRVVVVPKKKSCIGNHKSCRCHIQLVCTKMPDVPVYT